MLAWSGPVVAPMRDNIAAALDHYKSDPRPVVIAMNSPGGSVAQGRLVAATIHDAGRVHDIDTLVAQGAACASMCLPIFLSGKKRMAAADAHFMFHEVKLDEKALKNAGMDAAAMDALRKVVEQGATDLLFENDIGVARVNGKWLEALRSKIVGRDVWLSGRELVEQGSGVIDELIVTSPG